MKPLLSAKIDAKFEYRFPYLASPKLDGIRCLIVDGVAVSRTLKPIPNKHIQSILGNPALNGLDGEIIVGQPNAEKCFQSTTTVVMSHDKVSEFTFYVFDDFTEPTDTFDVRLTLAAEHVGSLPIENREHISVLSHVWVDTEGELTAYESSAINAGYEGVMLRSPNGHYKFGRSTSKEQILVKVKRYSDDEAEVIDFVELLHNDNEATIDNLGHTKRSTHKDNKRPANTLGTLVVRNQRGVEFEIGTGFTAHERQQIWDDRKSYLGKQLTYKYFDHGIIDKPRHPVFKGWRAPGF